MINNSRIPRNFGRGTSRDNGQNYPRRSLDSYVYESYVPSRTAANDGYEKPLPANLDAEAGLLGSILIDPNVLPRVTWLDPKMFSREAHRLIFLAMLGTLRRERVYREKGDEGNPGDLIQTCDELERLGKIEEVGGISYVSSLANQVPTSANWRYYAEIVERCAIYRRLISAAGQIAALAYLQGDLDEVQAETMRLIGEALQTHATMPTRWLGAVLDELSEQTEARMRGDIAAQLMHAGIRVLDAVVGGMDRGELWIIAGRPRHGKSALGQGILLHMLDEERDRALATNSVVGTALYVTLEMSGTRQARRMVSSIGGINGWHIRQGFRDANGDVDEDGWNDFLGAIGEAHSRYATQVQFEEDNLNLDRLEQIVARAVLEDHCKVVLVDQLDLLDADDPRLNADEYRRVSEAVRRLKQIASRYKVLILCLCQLSRDAEGVVPEITHLRATGRVEQDADGIVMVYRPSASTPKGSSSKYWKYYAEAYMPKFRDGESDEALPLCFDGQTTTFSDWNPDWPIPVLDADEDDDPIAKRRAKSGKGKTGGKGERRVIGAKPSKPSRGASAPATSYAEDDENEDTGSEDDE